MKKFDIPNIYKSPLISEIKMQKKSADKLKKDFAPTELVFGNTTFFLARHFGFCYGVENAIEIAFRTINENPGKNIFLLSEMIHNPQVNRDLEERGVRFIQDTYGKQLIPFEDIMHNDIVLIPAFGTTLEIENMLAAKGIATEKYDTTCPFVEKVWNRSAQIAAKGYSIIVHGKPKHEETRATFSHASYGTPTIIVNDMEEAEALAVYMRKEKPIALFYEEFKGRYSKNFDVERDLQRIGVVNQTTQLATETQHISDFFKEEIKKIYGSEPQTISAHFADTKDTLCYATNDNQNAVKGMLDVDADVAIVVGGYNSSNTSHLVELCEAKLPAYFINAADKIISKDEIINCNWKTKEITRDSFLPPKEKVKILLTCGASCPDSVVEEVIKRTLVVTGEIDKYAEMLSLLETKVTS